MALVYGLVIGSFLNVVIWRLPRGGSIASPTWSYCPRCEHRLGAIDLVPVLSFLFLRARCRYCKTPISWRYPAIELLTGLLFLAVTWRFIGQWEMAVFACLFVALLLCVFFIDLEHFIIPDGLSVLMALLGFIHNAIAFAMGRAGQWTRFGTLSVPMSLAGFFGYGAALYGIGLLAYVWITARVDKRQSAGRAAALYIRDNATDWLYVSASSLAVVVPPLRAWVNTHFGAPEPLAGFTAAEIEDDEDAGGMGGGDGKLAAAIGANLGLALALESGMFAIFLGAFSGAIVLAQQRRALGERTAIPFGPAMAAGALLALLFGRAALDWYLSRF